MSILQQIQEMIGNLFQWWVVITPWQQAVRVRFGKRTELLLPGVHVRFPFIDIIYMQPIRTRAQHIGSQTLTTKDKKSVSLSSALQYNIMDLLKLYQTLHNAHDTIEQITQGHVGTFIRKQELDGIDADDLEKYILDNLNLEQYGLKAVGFKLTSFTSVRTYRLISGEIGAFTSFQQRLDTDRVMGDKAPL